MSDHTPSRIWKLDYANAWEMDQITQVTRGLENQVFSLLKNKPMVQRFSVGAWDDNARETIDTKTITRLRWEVEVRVLGNDIKFEHFFDRKDGSFPDVEDQILALQIALHGAVNAAAKNYVEAAANLQEFAAEILGIPTGAKSLIS